MLGVRRLSVMVAMLCATVSSGQPASDDDLSKAFDPPPPPKAFKPEGNVPPPPLPEDPNAELRAGFERDLAAAQHSFDTGDTSAAKQSLALAEVTAVLFGGPERVRVHRLQHAVAAKLGDRPALREADEKWLLACGPHEVEACRAAALEALSRFDRPWVEKVRAADSCLAVAERALGQPPPACVNTAYGLYQKAGDTLMVARVDLLRALALASASNQAATAKKALTRLAAVSDDRVALVRRTALETLSRLELAEGLVDDAARDAILATEAYASTLPPARRAWARLPAVDRACAAYDKARSAGACRVLEKKLLGTYVFHDFSDEHIAEGHLLGRDKLVEVNEHYGVMIRDCLAEEIRTLESKKATGYRVRWLVLNDGRVDNFHSESTQQEQARFIQCLRNQFGYWRYPSHEGDPQRVEQSFTLKSTTRTSGDTSD